MVRTFSETAPELHSVVPYPIWLSSDAKLSASLYKKYHSLAQYMAIGHFGELANLVLQLN